MSIKSIRTGWTGISALAGNPVIGDYESIQTITVTSATQAAVEFTSIPSGYSHLQIRGISRTNRADNLDQLYMQFNGDTSANYTRHFIVGDGANASSFGEGGLTAGLAIYTFGANTNANIFGACVYDIVDYKDTNKFKTTRVLIGGDRNGAGHIALNSSLWRSTSAIESIKIYPISGNSFVTNTHFALYGIR